MASKGPPRDEPWYVKKMWFGPGARPTAAAVAVAGRCALALASGATMACGNDARDSAASDAAVDRVFASREEASAADAGADGQLESDVDVAASDDGGPRDAVAEVGRDFSTDRSRFFGASRCDDAGLQLCEDFEKGTLNGSLWTVAGGAPVIDGYEHARGSKALGVGTDNRTDAGNATGDWTNSDRDPNGSPTAVPVGQWICLEWMHKGDTNETAFWWDGADHPSLSTSATIHGGNSNPYELPQFTKLWLGWQVYQTSTETFELWLDEIAIDPRRIGCVL